MSSPHTPPTPTPSPTPNTECSCFPASNVTNGIQIPTYSTANPFPITFNVTGINTPITRIKVLISGYTHGDVSDVGMILRAPTGPDTDSAVLIGRYDGTPISANNVDVTLTDFSTPDWDGTSSGTYGSNPYAYKSMQFTTGDVPYYLAGQTGNPLSYFIGRAPAKLS